MRKSSFWTSIAVLVLSASFVAGCNSDEAGGESNKEMIDSAQKSLPPVDPNAPLPEIPTRDGGSGNMPGKKGGP
jgi:hypothetical protein